MTTDVSASSNSDGRNTPVVPSKERVKVERVVSAKVSIPQRLKNIWLRRELLLNLISTEIKVKYKGSVLGILWSMVSPAMTLLIYWLVFGMILKSGIPNFVIYLFAGLLFWNFFQLGVQTATGVIVARAGIVKKVAFPREILALASVGTAGVFFFFQCIVMVIFMVVLGVQPDWELLPLLLVTLFAVVLIASALGIAFSAINVSLRDTSHIVEVVLTAWFWACPVVYSYWAQIHAHMHHAWEVWLYMANPLTPLVLTSQRVIYAKPLIHLTTPGHPIEQVLPPWHASTYIYMNLGLVGFGVVLMVIAMMIFGRLEGNFTEVL